MADATWPTCGYQETHLAIPIFTKPSASKSKKRRENVSAPAQPDLQPSNTPVPNPPT
ncbi:hypothetical protein LX36DRAFT_663146 [Colletotrichum falcatum]|nr:hypothetical protein LX36DRAFT_663146 [Colletotrichum falcatum]